MSASAILPVASPAPEPARVGPDAPARDALPRIGRLLGIVRSLVAYGTNLLTAMRQDGSVQQARAMLVFGTKDLALIIERIKCGLLRAAGLETRLNRFVKRGRDLQPPPFRMPMPRVRKQAADAAAPEAFDAAAPRAVEPRPAAPPAVLSHLPSAEEIAEQVRSRAIDVVISDICRDLGLPPGMMDVAMWREISAVLVDCGLRLSPFVRVPWTLMGEGFELEELPWETRLALTEALDPDAQPP